MEDEYTTHPGEQVGTDVDSGYIVLETVDL